MIFHYAQYNRSGEGESREHFMEEGIFELGPAGGKSLRLERKEISHRRMLEAKLGQGGSANE